MLLNVWTIVHKSFVFQNAAFFSINTNSRSLFGQNRALRKCCAFARAAARRACAMLLSSDVLCGKF